jgi:hypothetical protein
MLKWGNKRAALNHSLLHRIGRNGEIKERGCLEPHLITIKWWKWKKERNSLEPHLNIII